MDGVADAVQSHQQEEGEHGAADGSVVLGVVAAEEDPAHHCVDVQHQYADEEEAQCAGQAAGDGHEHDAQLGQEASGSQDAGEAQQAQYGRVLAHDGQERAQDHGEVEEVPGILEELPGAIGVRGQTQQDLHGEGGQAGVFREP